MESVAAPGSPTIVQLLVLRLFRTVPLLMLGLVAVVPSPAQASATAQGVALNTSASCSNASLDLSLTTIGAIRESGQSTNLAGTVLDSFEQPTVTFANFSGTYVGYVINVAPTQPPGTLIGSYAYVGTTPPSSATTAEFFVYYNCSTGQVLLSCFGPYGTCPQTAVQAQAALSNAIPTLDPWVLVLAMLLLGGSASVALRRR